MATHAFSKTKNTKRRIWQIQSNSKSYKPLSRCGHLDFTQFQLIVTKTEAGQNTSLAPCAMLAFIIVIGNREHDQNSDSVIGLYILQLKSKGTTGVHVIGTLMYCEIWTFIVSTICWIWEKLLRPSLEGCVYPAGHGRISWFWLVVHRPILHQRNEWADTVHGTMLQLEEHVRHRK